MSPKEIADKILNCKTYDIPDIQELASAYLELEKEKARLILHIDDIEKANDNCQTKIANLELEITKLKEENEKLKKSREALRRAVEFYSDEQQWNCTPEKLTTYNTIGKDDLGIGDFHLTKDVDDDRVGGKKAREAIKADDEIMGGKTEKLE